MSLFHLIALLQNYEPLRGVTERLSRGERQTIVDLPEAARPAITAAVAAAHGRRTIVITSRRDRADAVAAALADYLPASIAVERWTPPDALPYEQLPHDTEASIGRVQILDRLLSAPDDAAVLVTPVQALLQLLSPPEAFLAQIREVRTGRRLDIQHFLDWAASVGYQQHPMVQEPGTIARRGGIVDIFPPGSEQPVRIDFFGDEVESIRHFDPHTQRSTERLARIRLAPPVEVPVWRLPEISEDLRRVPTSGLRSEVADEWHRLIEQARQGIVPASVDLFSGYLVPGESTLIDYLPSSALVVIDQPGSVRLALEQTGHQAAELERTFIESGELPAGLARPFASAGGAFRRLAAFATLAIGPAGERDDGAVALDRISDPPLFGGRITDLVADLRGRLEQGWRVAIATDQVDRITDILEEHDIFPRREKPPRSQRRSRRGRWRYDPRT